MNTTSKLILACIALSCFSLTGCGGDGNSSAPPEVSESDASEEAAFDLTGTWNTDDQTFGMEFQGDKATQFLDGDVQDEYAFALTENSDGYNLELTKDGRSETVPLEVLEDDRILITAGNEKIEMTRNQ